MKTELRNCPFCDGTNLSTIEGVVNDPNYRRVRCEDCWANWHTFNGASFDHWNNRPIEDGLQAEIEKLKKQVKEQPTTKNALSKVVKKAHWLCGEPEVGRWHNLTGKIKKERE